MRDWIVSAIQSTGAWGVGFLMFVENVIPPIPSEVIMPLAGYLASQDKMNLWVAIAGGSVGSLLGATLWYEVGRRLGHLPESGTSSASSPGPSSAWPPSGTWFGSFVCAGAEPVEAHSRRALRTA